MIVRLFGYVYPNDMSGHESSEFVIETDSVKIERFPNRTELIINGVFYPLVAPSFVEEYRDHKGDRNPVFSLAVLENCCGTVIKEVRH